MAWWSGEIWQRVFISKSRSGRELGECFEKILKKKNFPKNLDFGIFFIFITMLSYGEFLIKMTFVHFDHDSEQMLMIFVHNGNQWASTVAKVAFNTFL